MLTCQSPRRRQDAVFRERGSAQRFLPAHAPACHAFNAISYHTKLFEPRPKTHGAGPVLQREQKIKWKLPYLQFRSVTMHSTPAHVPLRCLLGTPFRPFGRSLLRNACFLFHRTLFHRMFDSRRSLGRFFGSHMFNMNPLNAPRRGMLLRPFEGRFKWHRLHKQ
jgi:hypothetical protein